jgi:hypothetical protein
MILTRSIHRQLLVALLAAGVFVVLFARLT